MENIKKTVSQGAQTLVDWAPNSWNKLHQNSKKYIDLSIRPLSIANDEKAVDEI